MEHRHPKSTAQAVPRTEPESQQHRAGALPGSGHQQGPAGQTHHASHLERSHCVHQHGTLMKPHTPVQQNRHQNGKGHKAQAAHLDQHHQHCLSKNSKLGPGVIQHQARHAGGGGGGEQSVQKRNGLPGPGGNRQHQQHRPSQDQAGEANGERLDGVEMNASADHRHLRKRAARAAYPASGHGAGQPFRPSFFLALWVLYLTRMGFAMTRTVKKSSAPDRLFPGGLSAKLLRDIGRCLENSATGCAQCACEGL